MEDSPVSAPVRALCIVLASAALASTLLTLARGGYDPCLAAEIAAAGREYADLSYPLNINEASKEELAAIDGVSARQAAIIVSFRGKIGVIPDLRMLLALRGIGPVTYERLERNTFVSFKDEPIRRPAPEGEPERAPEDPAAAAPDGECVPHEPAGGVPRVPLNAASAAEIAAIRGIGPKTAAAIVAERERRGGFREYDDLLAVRGIGPKRIDSLRERFSLGY